MAEKFFPVFMQLNLNFSFPMKNHQTLTDLCSQVVLLEQLIQHMSSKFPHSLQSDHRNVPPYLLEDTATLSDLCV